MSDLVDTIIINGSMKLERKVVKDGTLPCKKCSFNPSQSKQNEALVKCDQMPEQCFGKYLYSYWVIID